MRNHRTTSRWGLIALVLAVCIPLQWFSQQWSISSAIDHIAGDRLHQLTASHEPEQRVIVVDIDEASIAAVGSWPWPRARIADLLEILASNYQARAVGVDIVFPSPADPAGDERLAALADFAPIVFAQTLDFLERETPVASGKPVFDAPPVAAFVEALPATGYLANHEGLSKGRCVGNIGLRNDADGRVRRVPLVGSWQGRRTALLPLAMLACPLQRGSGRDVLANATPAMLGREWELPFSRAWEAYTVIPAKAILDGTAPAELVRGRFVLVGSSALGLYDRAPTPVAASTAGVMVHAAAMTSMLDLAEGRLQPLPVDGRWIAAAWMIVTLCACAWALGRFKAWWLIPSIVLVTCGWLVLVAWLMREGATFSPGAPLLAYAMMLFVVLVELWLTQREQGQLLRSFATYVAPSVLREMLRSGLDNPMVPQHREITVLSADMQDYTGLTNRSSLQDAARLTREFLQCLTEPILEHGGTLDKYTGDGLVAFWGAPIPDARHAAKALDASRAIVENVRRWNETRVAQGLVPARVRLGVDSGEVLVGDLGTRFRHTYTAVGDCINTASKLQAAAKTLPHDLLVGPEAARLAPGSGLVAVAQVHLPGHQQATTLWSFPMLKSSLPGAPLGADALVRANAAR